MSSPGKRAIIITSDGASMKLVRRMAQEGHMPNVARLLEVGVHREMLGVVPTLTPPGWTTLSVGLPANHPHFTANTSNGLVAHISPRRKPWPRRRPRCQECMTPVRRQARRDGLFVCG